MPAPSPERGQGVLSSLVVRLPASGPAASFLSSPVPHLQALKKLILSVLVYLPLEDAWEICQLFWLLQCVLAPVYGLDSCEPLFLGSP